MKTSINDFSHKISYFSNDICCRIILSLRVRSINEIFVMDLKKRHIGNIVYNSLVDWDC